MAYQRIVNMEIVEVIRRYFDSQNISQISKLSGIDRKTIRKYIKEVIALGITGYDKEKILSVLPDIIPKLTGRPTKACCFRRKLTNIPAKIDHPKLVIF